MGGGTIRDDDDDDEAPPPKPKPGTNSHIPLPLKRPRHADLCTDLRTDLRFPSSLHRPERSPLRFLRSDAIGASASGA